MEDKEYKKNPVMLNNVNYLSWSRTMRTTLSGRGLWSHCLTDKEAITEARIDQGELKPEEEKWFQQNQKVLGILQGSLEPSILGAYFYCGRAKELWSTLQTVYGNTSNLSRTFEVKKAINDLYQEDMEFTKHFGRFRSLWAELEMLRPSTVDPKILNERREQDKVFGLLLTLNSSYKDVIKHLLRSDTLPDIDVVCAQLQKEQGSSGLFDGKKELVTANKVAFKPSSRTYEERRIVTCEHCKKKGHTKDKCWNLYPNLKPSKFRDAKAHFTNDDSVSLPSTSGSNHGKEEESSAIVPYTDEFVRKSDLEALIKALRGNGIHPYSLSAQILNKEPSKMTIIDSGASHHMISNLNLINNVKPALGNVIIANGSKIPIEGLGNLKLFNKESQALYMPSFTSNLISVKRIACDLNCNVIFGPNDVIFQDIKSKEILGKGVTRGDLYVLEENKSSSLLCHGFNSVIAEANNVIWHFRLGHPHLNALKTLLPNVSFDHQTCEACIKGKHCRTVFPKSTMNYKLFELIHSDVWSSPCKSRDNHAYFVTFIDENSKYTWITLLQSKDRVLEAFKNFQNYVTNHYDAKIKIFRSDNGGEYTSRTFKEHIAKHGILHQTTCPYTPQQNGVAERKNRHLMEVTRSMMFHMNIPKRFWSDGVLTACYLINRTPTQVLNNRSPFEVLNKNKPFINHLRVFGCVCFVFVPSDQRNKLEAKSTKAMFIGYSNTQKGYKCYDPETRRVLVSRDVKFLEGKSFYDDKNWESVKDLPENVTDKATNLRNLMMRLGMAFDEEEEHEEPTQQVLRLESTTPQSHAQEILRLDHAGENRLEHASSEHQESNMSGGESNAQEEQQASTKTYSEQHEVQSHAQEVHDQEEHQGKEESLVPRRSTREKKQREYYSGNVVAHPTQVMCSLASIPGEHKAFITSLDQHVIPRTYEEAIKYKEWRDAVKAENKAMEDNETYYEADLPKGKRAVSSRYVFTIKYHSNGEIERYKARLVARGFTQTYGEDYLDTFAPVAKLHTVRVILSLATNLSWDLFQMDVKNAFLQGELEEEVYMTPPPGLEKSVTHGKVLRLRKAIYGLKQSPRAWYHKLSSTLMAKGFKRSQSEHTLFTLQNQEGIVVVLVYVDDIIISGSNKGGIQETKTFLKSKFDIKDLGKLKYFLGIEVCRSEEGLVLSQRKYTHDLLSVVNMIGTKEAKTPLEDNYKIIQEGSTEDQPYHDPKLYRRIVGKLIYLTITRPDLCFAVNQISQHMQKPKQHHWNMIMRILGYIKGTSSMGIWMGRNKSTEIIGYCDADYAGNLEDRRSTTGYCTFIGGNLVTWKTKKQKIVSCSTAEAEYRAMRKLTQELMWLKNLLKDLGIECEKPMTMHCDNQAAIHIASNSVFHERTKHIEIDCHKVREQMIKGTILPCYTKSEDQLADIFTKSASLKVCESILPRLGLTRAIQA